MPLHTSNIVMNKTDTTPAGAYETEGSLYYDDSEAQLKHYNGSAWSRVSTALISLGGDTISTYQHAGTGTTYRVHIFTASGSLITYDTLTMDIFIVGGGGGGGNGLGGGGGGGVIVHRANYVITSGTYTITIGDGAATQTSGDAGGHYGVPSSTDIGGSTITALGGGGGGGEPDIDPQGSTANWGNSGGGSYNESSRFGTTTNSFSGWTVYAGGQGGTGGGSGSAHPSGGGGSPAAAAANVPNNVSAGHGANGDNRVTWVTPRLFGESGTHQSVTIDAPYYWGGGGGGGKHTNSTPAGNGGYGGGGGGAAGGGSSGSAPAYGRTSGTAGAQGGNAAGGVGGINTGGGGGGGVDGTGNGGAGGKGIIIVRYAID